MNSINPINSINVPNSPDALSQFASLTLWPLTVKARYGKGFLKKEENHEGRI